MDLPAPPPAAAGAPRPAAWRRPWVRELAAHLLAAAVTAGLLVLGLGLVAVRHPDDPAGAGAVVAGTLPGGGRLEVADLRAPFQYTHDALLILPLVKATVERGSHWRNERLGAPGVQELYDFPVVDHLHFAVIWVIGRLVGDPVVAFNLFHLLTYPLTTLTGMFVLRRFGLSVPAAAAGGTLYAFQPYHQLRGQLHYFLAAYYVVPLTLMVVLWVCRGRLPFFRPAADSGRLRFTVTSRDTLAAVAVAAVTSAAGAYYAFFACAFLAAAGAYGWVATRTWRAAASAAGVIGVVVAGGVVQHLPAFAYQARYGENTRPTLRWAEEAEMYGLRIAQLVLPIGNHNNVEVGGRLILDVAGVRTRYDSALRPLHQFEEPDWDPLGAVAAAGFVGLLAVAVLPVGRGWPVGPLSALSVFGTLLGTVGGAGDLFNLLVTPQIRCHNRVSIYLAFLALFAVCRGLDRVVRPGWPKWAAFGFLTLFGVWDQTDHGWFPAVRTARPEYVPVDAARDKVAAQFAADRGFFAAVEEVLPDGMVFCLPMIPYPEAHPYEEPGSPGRTAAYDMARGYLHTARLRWSFGAMKGREWDAWQRDVAGMAVGTDHMLLRITLAGFGGLLVDRRGLKPARYAGLVDGLNRVLGDGSPRVAHPDGSLVFFDLRGARTYFRPNFGPAAFDALCRKEQEGLSWLWLKGFDSYEPVGYERRQRWCTAAGTVVAVNPSDRPRAALVSMRLHTWFGPESPLRISGGAVWAETIPVGEAGVRVARTLVLPPGRHTIRFRCDPPPGYTFPDSRDLVFGVKDFSLTEVPVPAE